MSENDLTIPSQEYPEELEWGSQKKIKEGKRRPDTIFYSKPDEIGILDGFNVRIRDESYLAHIQSIKESMLADGFHPDKPISVVVKTVDDQPKAFVVNGHSRLEAAKLAIAEGADFDEVPLILHSKTVNMDLMLADLIKSNSGRPLTAYEAAIVCSRLLNRQLTEAEISRKTGLSPSYVNGLLLLAQAPQSLANLVINGTISATVAIDEIRRNGVSAATKRLVRLAAERVDPETGKQGKITAKSLPGAKFKSVLKKKAETLYERAQSIKRDPGFASLSQENREALENLLVELESNKPAEESENE